MKSKINSGGWGQIVYHRVLEYMALLGPMQVYDVHLLNSANFSCRGGRHKKNRKKIFYCKKGGWNSEGKEK